MSDIITANMTMDDFYLKIIELTNKDATINDIPEFAKKDFLEFAYVHHYQEKPETHLYSPVIVNEWIYKVLRTRGLSYQVVFKKHSNELQSEIDYVQNLIEDVTLVELSKKDALFIIESINEFRTDQKIANHENKNRN